MSVSTSTSVLTGSLVKDFEGQEFRKANRLTTFYASWAKSYEWDMHDMGYRLPAMATILLMDNVDNSKSKDCFVIDVGCGTGLVGASLRKKGFAGILHGVDENENMLNIADKKSAYNDLFLQNLCMENKIDTTGNLLYDGCACIAAFGSEHIHPKMLPVFVDHVKSEGVLVFSVAHHPRDEADKKILDEEIEKLVESNAINEVMSTQESYFARGVSSRASEMAATCQLYCFTKT